MLKQVYNFVPRSLKLVVVVSFITLIRFPSGQVAILVNRHRLVVCCPLEYWLGSYCNLELYRLVVFVTGPLAC